MSSRSTEAALKPPLHKRIFIECTHTYHSDVNTGIQRVVRNILRNAAEVVAPHGYEIVPVIFSDGHFVVADVAPVLADKRRDPGPGHQTSGRETPWPRRLRTRLLSWFQSSFDGVRSALERMVPTPRMRRFLYAPTTEFGMAWCVLLPWRLLRRARRLQRGMVRSLRCAVRPVGPASPLHCSDSIDSLTSQQGNLLLLLDSSWSYRMWSAVERFRTKGGLVNGVMYDLIPITHPHTNAAGLTASFKTWLSRHLRHSHGLLAISEAVADQLRRYIAAMPAPPAALPWIESFQLGSELDFMAPDDLPRPGFTQIFAEAEHIFIVVGSIEPRKNHRQVLDAFDAAWAAGSRARLLIIGKHGWKNEDLLLRIATHPRRDQQLFLQRDVTDAELDYAYRNASALVIASEAEGFGLPVVEAFQRGLPVMCSDIPVFREIADGRASFFHLHDAADLARVMQAYCDTHAPADRGHRRPQPWISWRDSTEQLFQAVLRHVPGQAAPEREPDDAGTDASRARERAAQRPAAWKHAAMRETVVSRKLPSLGHDGITPG